MRKTNAPVPRAVARRGPTSERASDLSTVEEVLRAVLSTTPALPSERRPIDGALGRVLAEDVRACGMLPPFSNAAMDGFAVRGADTEAAPVELPVVGATMAGEEAGRIGPGEALRIMTGAPIPEGADAVVAFEDVAERPGRVGIRRPVAARTNVRQAGEDVSVGEVAVRAGTVLGPSQLALLAGLGSSEVVVACRPRVAVLSTGDELVPAGGPGSATIRDANRPALLGAVTADGFSPLDIGIVGDDAADLAATVQDALGRSDVVICSGGVSNGDRDVFLQAIRSLPGSLVTAFDVAVRPGRPFAYARVGPARVYGLAGNPAAATLSYELFVRPALRRMAGHRQLLRPRLSATADAPLGRRPDGKVHFVRAAVSIADDGRLHLVSAGEQQSHRLAVGAAAAGLAILPDGEGVPCGGEVELMVLDWEQVRTTEK